MRNSFALLAASLLLSLAACKSITTDDADRSEAQMIKQFKFQKSQNVKVGYLLFLPKDYETKSGKHWPLILFLHGAGERGNDVRKVAIHGPPNYVTKHPDFPFIVVSPQCPEGEHWSNDILLGLLDEMIRRYAVDTRRIYLTGLSMGGYGSWDLGMSYPEKFAALVPICGGGQMITLLLTSRSKPRELKSLPVWAFHGAKDPVVPVEETERMVDALKKVGAKEVKLTIYPQAGHNSWTETYENPQLYEWLLQHERGK